MRGKQSDMTGRPSMVRITPADAGKTGFVSGKLGYFQDHPRGCGENCFRVHPASSCTGSPPRMRGKLRGACRDAMLRGITPADAGKTKHAANRVNLLRDHPRGCGENQPSCPKPLPLLGSPPRMRGKLEAEFCKQIKHGITPADAGKTHRRCSVRKRA